MTQPSQWVPTDAEVMAALPARPTGVRWTQSQPMAQDGIAQTIDTVITFDAQIATTITVQATETQIDATGKRTEKLVKQTVVLHLSPGQLKGLSDHVLAARQVMLEAQAENDQWNELVQVKRQQMIALGPPQPAPVADQAPTV